jgi:hypothetical protein
MSIPGEAPWPRPKMELSPENAVYHPTVSNKKEIAMYNIVWLVGAVVIILAVLSFFGLR